MMAARFEPRNFTRFAARSTFRTRLQQPFLQSQKRFASYQRFPARAGETKYGAYSSFRPYARAQYVWRNYRTGLIVAGAGGGTFYVTNLEEVPITGRRRFNCISPETEQKLLGGGDAYESMVNEFRGKILPSSHPYTQLVARIVENLLPSVQGLAGEDWRVHVIDDPQMVNAFVMPGGKVFVFTGLLPIAQDENGLAAVLGHEIAHNVAHHTAEKLSRQGFVMLASVLFAMLWDVSGQLSSSIVDLFLNLPNGRTQESEADHIGLLMMAQSCYDPNKVPDLWKRMAESEKGHGGAPPQFLSTHPSSASRAETIRGWLPQANARFEESGCAATSRRYDEFKRITQTPKYSDFMAGARQPIQKSGNGDWPF